MINVLLKKIFGSKNDREIKRMRPVVGRVGALEPAVSRLTDQQLGAKSDEFRKRLADGAQLDDLLSEAFAVCREISKRKLKMSLPLTRFQN